MAHKIETIETEKKVGGNTNLQPEPIKKQGLQLKSWFFTYNNYTLTDIETIETKFKEICVKYVFQQEKGAEGTKHLQGFIKLKKKMRWTEFGLPNGIHWEKPRKDSDCEEYCCKEATRDGQIYTNIPPKVLPEPLDVIEKLHPWQEELMKLFEVKANNRDVIWVYDRIGNIGKSTFTTHLYDTKPNTIFIDGVDKKDIINGIFNFKLEINHSSIVMLDIPRHAGNHVCYSAIESIKNGLIFNQKYETGSRRFNSPHIIIFANEPPVITQLSLDRWKIFEIVEGQKLIKKDVCPPLIAVEA